MIIGREKEIKELETALRSTRPEFVVLYGRRRVGKTYLIDNVYREAMVFRHAGLPPKKATPKERLARQLAAFSNSLLRYDIKPPRKLSTWFEAFGALERYLDSFPSSRRVVVFLDELPWMDTVSSGFLDAFGDFWNNYLCFHDNMLLAVTGSASSWILDHLIHSTEGFYRRVTHEILLQPFTLRECQNLLSANGVAYSQYEVAKLYMAVGGIPYYLNYFAAGESVAQNIDRLFFGQGAKLSDEFSTLFASQFAKPKVYEAIVRALAEKGSGLDAKQLGAAVGLKSSGPLYEMLRALERSRFIEPYTLFGESKRETKYKLIDPFCYFYLKQVEPHQGNASYWSECEGNPSSNAYYGYAFETLCFAHQAQIKQALGIAGIGSSMFPFAQRGETENAQIDLVIRRQDNVVNLCEAKWSLEEYAMDKTEHLALERKKRVLESHLLKRESIHCVLLTTFGLRHGEYYSDFANVITLDNLFL